MPLQTAGDEEHHMVNDKCGPADWLDIRRQPTTQTCTATALPSTATSPSISSEAALSTTSEPVLSLASAEVPVRTNFSSGL